MQVVLSGAAVAIGVRSVCQRWSYVSGLVLKDQIAAYVDGVQAGKQDRDIQAELELDKAAFAVVKQEALDTEVERLRGVTTEQIYVEYCLAQRGCIADLNTLLDRENVQTTAYVGAVKARSEILDKMIKLGQDFGLISKEPDRKQIMAGLVVTQLSNEELRTAIADQLGALNSLVSGYGDQPFGELDPGKLYREPPPKLPSRTRVNPPTVVEAELQDMVRSTTKEKTDKHNRAKANKVHKGRRVVKPPRR